MDDRDGLRGQRECYEWHGRDDETALVDSFNLMKDGRGGLREHFKCYEWHGAGDEVGLVNSISLMNGAVR